MARASAEWDILIPRISDMCRELAINARRTPGCSPKEVRGQDTCHGGRGGKSMPRHPVARVSAAECNMLIPRTEKTHGVARRPGTLVRERWVVPRTESLRPRWFVHMLSGPPC